ncbi:DNA-3-methyladenine glycosylase [Levilactobacillus spicheri]|uniref:DNA-3-methyladenine glycosylase n=1 Tax=Levilactobacillus spicheri TaxID=216463 RepID=UPI00069C7011|nr:DNA-3-methyladenine glycosylase [Levilactobacillus spicheri]
MSEFSRTFQQTATDQLARDLLGVTLCYQTPRGRVSGWIVEDEAYLGVNDPASFAYHGHQDRRNLPCIRPVAPSTYTSSTGATSSTW